MGDYLFAERGCVYEWNNPDSSNNNSNYCLVVSSNSRAEDNLVSILFLSTYRGAGKDVVKLRVNGETLCVHADLVTYTKRAYLVKKVGPISKEAMTKIDLRMSTSLDLERRDRIYEELYNDLVSRMVNS